MICPNCKSSYSSICLKCGYDPKTNLATFSAGELGIDELPHVPMEVSHVWLGKFPNEASLEEYLEETIRDDDVTPMNVFAKSQGEVFYDHDWVEASFEVSDQLRSLIEGHSYSSDYIDEVISFANANGIENANTFILADVNEFKDPKSVHGQDVCLWYVGKFKCNV